MEKTLAVINQEIFQKRFLNDADRQE